MKRLRQLNIRAPELTRLQILRLRESLGLRSDAAVIVMAVDRMAREELARRKRSN